jgi:hypothetical protein
MERGLTVKGTREPYGFFRRIEVGASAPEPEMRADLGPCPRDPDGREAGELANALQGGNTQETPKRTGLNAPRRAKKRGIWRTDYIKRVIVENNNALGAGDSPSDAKEKTPEDTQEPRTPLQSDRWDHEAQAGMRAIKGLGTEEATLITIRGTQEEEDNRPWQRA